MIEHAPCPIAKNFEMNADTRSVGRVDNLVALLLITISSDRIVIRELSEISN